MSVHLNDAIAALEATIFAIRGERQQSDLLIEATRSIAEWRSAAFDRLLFQEGTIHAGAYVWRRIARPLIGVRWTTLTRADFAEKVETLARLALKAQGSGQYGEWPREEVAALEREARTVRKSWTVTRRRFRRDLDEAERAAEKALAALREA